IRGVRIALALAAVVVSASGARADLAIGRDKWTAGDYKVAIAELAKATGKDKPAARILMARAQLMTGDYAGAEATIKAESGVEAHLVYDELRRATGRAAE